jgi:hypothetical protein
MSSVGVEVWVWVFGRGESFLCFNINSGVRGEG